MMVCPSPSASLHIQCTAAAHVGTGSTISNALYIAGQELFAIEYKFLCLACASSFEAHMHAIILELELEIYGVDLIVFLYFEA